MRRGRPRLRVWTVLQRSVHNSFSSLPRKRDAEMVIGDERGEPYATLPQASARNPLGFPARTGKSSCLTFGPDTARRKTLRVTRGRLDRAFLNTLPRERASRADSRSLRGCQFAARDRR